MSRAIMCLHTISPVDRLTHVNINLRFLKCENVHITCLNTELVTGYRKNRLDKTFLKTNLT